jgi:TolB-like protein
MIKNTLGFKFLLFAFVVSFAYSAYPQFKHSKLTDGIRNTITELLEYESIAITIEEPSDRAAFYRSVSEEFSHRITELPTKYNEMFEEYSITIENLCKGIDYPEDELVIIDIPEITYFFKAVNLSKKAISKQYHQKQVDKLLVQYLTILEAYQIQNHHYENYIHFLKLEIDKKVKQNEVIIDISKLPSSTALYVMEFTNIDNHPRANWLTTVLPDIIIEKYSNRPGVTVDYAGSMSPYLEPDISRMNKQNILISGSYLTTGDTLKVFIELVDLISWNNLGRGIFYAYVEDVQSIHDQFTVTLGKILKQFLPLGVSDSYIMKLPGIDPISVEIPSSVIIEDEVSIIKPDPFIEKNLQPITIESELPKENTQNITEDLSPHRIIGNNILSGLEELENLSDTYYKLKITDSNQGQYGNRYYRNYESQLVNNNTLDKEKNTSELIEIFDRILTNPYHVFIGDMDIELSNVNHKLANIEIPIEFSVKSVLIEDMLTNLPHEKIVKENGLVMLQFSDEEFNFSDDLINRLSLLKYQVTPLIFFSNSEGVTQEIIIDSWQKKYDSFIKSDVKITRLDKFDPLLAITPGFDKIQISIDTSANLYNYKFSVKIEDLIHYEKVMVKFVHESELDEYLSVTFRNK